MKASVIDLRYKMKEILKALDHGEQVTILYHGKEKAVISPARSGQTKKVEDHPFFGMAADQQEPVTEVMEKLRGSRFNAF